MGFFQNSRNIIINSGSLNVVHSNHSYNVQAVNENVVHLDSYNTVQNQIDYSPVIARAQAGSEFLLLLF